MAFIDYSRVRINLLDGGSFISDVATLGRSFYTHTHVRGQRALDLYASLLILNTLKTYHIVGAE